MTNKLKWIPKYGMYAAGLDEYSNSYALYQLASIYGWYVILGGEVSSFILWCGFLALNIFLKRHIYGE